MIRSKTASHARLPAGTAKARVKRMAFFWAFLAVALHVWPGIVPPAQAQGSRKDDIVFNSRGVPLAGATVRVCAMPATGQPCTPLALIYSDAALTQALANPTATDGLGNYFFYAAPGKYEIEISGPGITTKQIPNVILPNDPSSPTFSGGISAFSLTLSGNLTVNGSTTVVGNLASGTLNLANQSTPPGTASSGTVNLYTKSADKRLYYKDDTGTEIGPIAASSGAQTNVTNTFTASQNFDNGLHVKGPDPYYDIMRFGGYFDGNPPPTTTGSITSGQTTLTTPTAFDVANGQYVTVYGAGPAATIYTPGAAVRISSISVSANVATVTVLDEWNTQAGQSNIIAGSTDAAFNGTFAVVSGTNPFTFNITHANCNPCTIGTSATVVSTTSFLTSTQGILNGATTYQYKIVAEDMFGGLTAASAPITMSTGAATLGVNSVSIAVNGCSRDSTGLTTITTTAAHNFQAGVPVYIVPGSTGDSSFEGQITINTTPTSTTFTFFQYQQPVKTNSCSLGGTAKVVAKNILRWNQRYSSIIGHWIYRCSGVGCSNYTLIGHSDGPDGSFIDYGLAGGLPNAPGYVPQGTPPSAPAAEWLSAKVTAGGGTTTLTLSVAASTTVSGATVLHDNTPAVIAICSGIGANSGGTIYFPDTTGLTFPITTNLDMRSSGTQGGSLGATCGQSLRVVQASQINAAATIFPPKGVNWEGLSNGANGGVAPGVGVKYQARIVGNAYPLMFIWASTDSGQTFENLNWTCNRAYQACFDSDATLGGGVGELFRNFSMQGNPGAFPFLFQCAFYCSLEYGLLSNGEAAANWGVPESFINRVPIGIGTSGTIPLSSEMTLRFVEFANGGMLFDSLGQTLGGSGGMGNIRGEHLLFESMATPDWRVNLSGVTNQGGQGLDLEFPITADTVGGSAMAMVDLSGIGNGSYVGISIFGSGCQGGQPLFSQSASLKAVTNISVSNNNCTIIGAPQAAFPSSGSFGTLPVTVNGTSPGLGFLMVTPSPAVSAVVSAGGSVPVGPVSYAITATDVNGNETLASGPITATTTSGNQTVTVTPPTLPAGAIGWFPYRCTGASCGPNVRAQIPSCNVPLSPTATFVDTASFTCGNGIPTAAAAQAAGVNATSPFGPSLKILGNFVDTLGGTFTATRTQTIPDLSGIVPITSYQNSAYDNFNRANGAIGSNWTVTQNGLNVTSNVLQGTTASQNNSALYSAVTGFSAKGQFAQVTVTALNGATDFVGPTVLGSGQNYYDCIVNSSSMDIQKVVSGARNNLTTPAATINVGDVIRFEVIFNDATLTNTLNCYQNGNLVATATDATYTSGSPGLLLFGNVATVDNWSGGNLHPLAHLDTEQDWTKTQHFTQGIALSGSNTESFNNSPRAEQNVFLPGALTSTWTGATWTTDKAVTITRIQVQAKTAPAGCTTNAVVRLTDGTTPVNVTISAAANDSGAIAQNYAAGASLTVAVQTAAAGCTTSPADANVVVQYRMQ